MVRRLAVRKNIWEKVRQSGTLMLRVVGHCRERLFSVAVVV